MKHSYACALLSALLVVCTGCAGIMTKPTPQSAGKVLQTAALFERGTKNLGNSEKVRTPLRTGQWVATLSRSKSDPNDVTLQVMKVVDIRGDTVTLEMEQYASTNEGQRMVIQQTIKNYPLAPKTAYTNEDATTLLGNIEIERVRIMEPSGEIAEMPQLPLGLGRSGDQLLRATVATGEIRSERCTAGRFAASRCYIVPFETKVLWVREKGTTYAHSAVPILGFLRSDSDGHEMELIGYGQRGAEVLIR